MTQQLEREIHETLEGISIHSESDNNELVAVSQSLAACINRNSSIKQVEEFMTTFNQVIGNKPSFPDEKTMELRLSIMLEELVELSEAMGGNMYNFMQRLLFKKSQEIHFDAENKRETLQPDLVKAIDALADQRYVNDGTIIALGMQKIFDEAFLEVHNSNMSKACTNRKELEDTLLKYEAEGIKVEGEPANNDKDYLVLRVPDRKVLKSINYKPAQLDKFIYQSI